MWMIWSGSSAWAPSLQAAGMEFPWWAWIFLIVFLVFLLFGIWVRARGKGVVKPEKDLISAANEPRSQPRPVPASPAGAHSPAQTAGDDLKIIEGIGPRISAIFNEAGISSFAQLAEAKPEKLEEIMKAANLRVPADPATWPEQARLAAAGEWEALQKLQDHLKGGRSVD